MNFWTVLYLLNAWGIIDFIVFIKSYIFLREMQVISITKTYRCSQFLGAEI